VEKLYPEFFNDVFGPVMQPGSSSHTAGPLRLGYLTRGLLSGPLREIHVLLDAKGSFAGTFGLMNEDLGMLAGAYGLMPDDERIFGIHKILYEEKIRYDIEFGVIEESAHANAVRFTLTGDNSETVTCTGNSIGGGMVETVCINGFHIKTRGDTFLTLLTEEGSVTRIEEARSALLPESEILEEGREVQTGRRMTWIVTGSRIPIPGKFHDLYPELRIFQIDPLLPVPSTPDKKPQLFDTFTDWIRISQERSQGLADTAVDYEADASGFSRERIRSGMETIRILLEKQTSSVYEEEAGLLETPYSGYHFRAWREYRSHGKPVSGDTLSLALYYAFGVQALCAGVKMLPGPMGTGGGYLYSVLRAVREIRNLTDEDVLHGLFVAAGVGAICYSRTEPTGEVIGCTGECGVCAAMASAGLTEMLHGTPEQVEAAASLTLQATIGWPCDPIPGGQNQPCLSRVVTAVTIAIAFSDLALSGRTAVLPFHEVVDSADAVGRNLPDSQKCTSCGGLCSTETGRRLNKEYKEWFAAKRP
jgi:L-serine dehydratase